jgi:CRP/FNR family transcriptional regulator
MIEIQKYHIIAQNYRKQNMIEKLKKIYLFEKLSDGELNKLVSIAQIKKFYANNIIFYAGDSSKYLHILIGGTAEVYKSDYKANKITMHSFNAPAIIAEVANLEHIPFPATCEAIEDCELILIDYVEFEKIFLSDPIVSLQIIKSLTKKIKALESTIDNNLVLDATARVAKFIYQHNDRFKMTKNVNIAKELNIKPETLSRLLKKLKDDNIIDKDGTIIDYEALKEKFIQ